MKKRKNNFSRKFKIILAKILNLLENNPTYIAILVLSFILLIVGTIVIGFLKVFIFLLLVDGVFIFLEYNNLYKKDPDENEDEDDDGDYDDDYDDFESSSENFDGSLERIRSSEVMSSRAKKIQENIRSKSSSGTRSGSTRTSSSKSGNKSKTSSSKSKVATKKNGVITDEELKAKIKSLVKEDKKPKKKSSKASEKKKKKSKFKLVVKVLLIIFFLIGTVAMVGVCLFFKNIVDEAPEFDAENLLMKESSIILDRDGNEINRIGNEQREAISYSDVSESLIDAIIATEDSRFFQHNGFDLPRFVKAAIGQAAGNEDAGGASTLTMQIIKNAYTVKNENTAEKSSGMTGIKRKFTDIYMAIFKLEKKYTKEEILEFYLNYSYLGSSSYGVEQASKTYFNKSAKDLNISEAALIAGLYQSPGSYDPLGGEEKRARCEQRRLTVLNLMKRHGYITDEELEVAKKLTVDKIVVGSRSNTVSPYQSFEDMVLKEVEERTGWDPNTTPLIIYSTLDTNKQLNINNVMNGTAFYWENEAVQGGVAVVDVHNGEIVAIGGGRNVDAAKLWNFATDEVRQIGSTSKPLYDYGPAIEYNNASTYGPVTDEQYSYTGGGTINNWDLNYYGFMTYREALRTSRNIPALKTFQTVDKANIYQFVTNLGLHPEMEDGYLHEAHSIGAYTGETPVSLAGAYAAFANGGYYNETHCVRKVVRRDTGEEFIPDIVTRKAMGEDTAYMITSILQDAAGWAGVSGINGVAIAAKTGTTNFDDKALAAKNLPGTAINDLWVAGYDSNYSVAVWYGYKTITAEDAAKGYYTVSGNHGNTNLFNAVGASIFSEANFPNPGNVVSVAVEKETSPAMLPSEFTPADQIITELFKSGTEPTEVSQRYARLADVTNLKATQNGQNITITWNGISTPDAISQDYLRNYFNTVYTNPSWQSSALGGRIAYNESAIGTIGYNVYLRNGNGELQLLDFVKGNSYTYKLKTSSNKDVSFVVRSCYSIFKANMSAGVETKLNVSANSAKIEAKLSTESNIAVKVGGKYTEPSTPVRVTENGNDVTSKATVRIESIIRKSDGATISGVGNIDTSKADTYEIKYSAKYSDESFTLTKTITIS